MRVSPEGQITIPVEIRKALALTPHTEVDLKYRAEACSSIGRMGLARGGHLPTNVRKRDYEHHDGRTPGHDARRG